MKLLKNEKTEKYHEIEVEYNFLFIKWRVKYRNVDGMIFEYKEPNQYFEVVFYEYFSIKYLFKIKI